MFVFCLGALSFVQTISCLQTIFNYSLSCYCSVYTTRIVTIVRRSSDSLNHFSRALFTIVSLFHALYACGCHSSILLRNRGRGFNSCLLRIFLHILDFTQPLRQDLPVMCEVQEGTIDSYS